MPQVALRGLYILILKQRMEQHFWNRIFQTFYKNWIVTKFVDNSSIALEIWLSLITTK